MTSSRPGTPTQDPLRAGEKPGDLPTEQDSERYQIREFLGAGGMAQVYRAWDSVLERDVALKVLRPASDQFRQRAQREAQAQARVAHRFVCQVFDAGELGGKPYVAMQLIEGPTLSEVATQLSLRQSVSVMQRVAEGVHAAHEVGLVHRDLKPGNVLMEPQEVSGDSTSSAPDWLPKIVDFGLAREVIDPDATETLAGGRGAAQISLMGELHGTPAYMAPEQARGQHTAIDRRTDVYALGAMLFELIAARPPFQGESTVDLLLQAVSATPPNLRSLVPDCPKALDTIVQRCLRKSPSERFATAQDVADEFGRFLNHQPILTSPPSLVERSSLWLRRHRSLALVTGTLGALMIAALFSWWLERRSVEKRRNLALQFGAEAAQLSAQMRVARLAPPHDLEADRERTRAQMDDLQRRIRAEGDSATAPGLYATGIAALGLHDFAAAQESLTAARAEGLRGAEIDIALATALLRRFGTEMANIYQLSTPLRRHRLQELEQSLLLPARDLLAAQDAANLQGSASLQGSGGFARTEPAVLLALAERRLEDLPTLVEAALAQDAASFELLELLGQAEQLRGLEADLAGQPDVARAHLESARDAYLQVGNIARSHAEAFTQACVAEETLLDFALRSGSSPDVPMPDSCRQAALLDPRSPQPRIARGVLLQRAGVAAFRRAEAFEPILRSARAELLAAQEQATAPGDTSRIDTALAIQALIENDLTAWHRNDNNEALEQAVDLARSAVANSGQLAPQIAVAQVLRGLARSQATQGQDPSTSVSEARRALDEVLLKAPKLPVALTTRANLMDWYAQHLLETGGDPEPAWQQARADFVLAAEVSPRNATVLINHGISFMVQATQLWYQGQDPSDVVRQGDALFARAVELSPGRPNLHYNRATLWEFIVRHAVREVEESGPTAQNALIDAHAEAVAAMNQYHALAYEADPVEYGCSAARVAWNNARWERRALVSGADSGGQARRLHIERGLADAERVLAIEPDSWRCRRDKARLLLERVQLASVATPEQRLADINLAAAEIRRALEASPASEELYWLLGEIERERSNTALTEEAERTAARRALEAYTRHSEIRPGRWNAAARTREMRARMGAGA